MQPVRCRRCGDVIGAYEPVVIRGHRGVEVTSRAIAQAIAGESDGMFHASCFAADDVPTRDPGTDARDPSDDRTRSLGE